jgi:hypothetical protein
LTRATAVPAPSIRYPLVSIAPPVSAILGV